MIEALTALLLAATEVRLETSVSAGGGYESNLNHAEEAGARVGAGFLALRASSGVALDVGERTGVYVGVRADGEHFPDLADLSTGTVGAEASFLRELGERWAVIVSPSAFASWSRDRTRDVTGWAGQLTVRVKPTRTVALRASYAHTSRDADDPVFSSERDRLGASVEVRLGERVHLSLGWTGERGDEVYYQPVVASPLTSQRMRGGPTPIFGEDAVPYRAEAEAHAVTPALEIALGPAVSLRGSYEYRRVARVTGDEGAFSNHAVFGGLVLRR